MWEFRAYFHMRKGTESFEITLLKKKFFSIIKLVFREKCDFYLFYDNALLTLLLL